MFFLSFCMQISIEFIPAIKKNNAKKGFFLFSHFYLHSYQTF